MKFKKWLENWDMTSLKVNVRFLEMEFQPKEVDMDAAWEMYVELLTRITTQPLAQNDGDEKTALDSIHALFAITREIIRNHGRDSVEFTKIAVIVLNQLVRPFTAKWHRLSLDDCFSNSQNCDQFREELKKLQVKLINYTQMLGAMAGVEEDLTCLEVIE